MQCTSNITLSRSRNHSCSANTITHSLCLVELHAIFNYLEILHVAKQRFYGKFMSPGIIKRKQIFVLSGRCCTEAKECSVAHGLLQTSCLAKQIVMIHKTLCSFSVFVTVVIKKIRDQTELIMKQYVLTL